MKRMSNAQKYLIKLSRRRSRGYPLATIAYYGPTDQLATKVAVGIRDRYDKLLEMRRWYSETSDIRADETVLEQIVAFMQEYDAQNAVTPDRIIGCPHEEGIDYPEGESCPQCPFWHGRDRWTGELLH
ncbi:MAG: hypothetical protein IPM39_13045 [Chloroflexi bacterium]|nr:hypothetical protein [Chloroflexota bacterium]